MYYFLIFHTMFTFKSFNCYFHGRYKWGKTKLYLKKIKLIHILSENNKLM